MTLNRWPVGVECVAGARVSVSEFGEPVRIATVALKQSALDIDRFLIGNAQLLPATYEFKLERFPVPGVSADGFGTGGVSGLRLPNDLAHVYSIRAGLNKLLLTKRAVDADGKGVIVEQRDLRNESELITESAGKIQFRRRAAKTALRRALGEIATFADRVASEKLTKIIG